MGQGLFWLVTILGYITTAYGLRCFECQDMPTPYDCETVVDCAPGDDCFLNQFVTASGYLLYNQGCKSTMMCATTTRRNSDVIRASTDVETCEECCGHDHCNNQGCRQSAPQRNSRGPYCYSCAAQSGEDRCRTVKTCAIDEACVVLNTTDINSPTESTTFQTGCIYITQCHALDASFTVDTSQTTGLSVIDKCPFCCREDFCNDNCNHNVSIVTTAPAINGHWSQWSRWSTCSASCGAGEHTRTRLCNNPAPQNNGNSCVGDNLGFATCSVKQCSVDGQWSSWSAWSSCTVTCGIGSAGRTRSCDHPVPLNGGQTCPGNNTDSEVCNTHIHCPVDGHWSHWSAWSPCTVTCGTGSAGRTRSCNHPAPLNGGQSCTGNNTESQVCNTQIHCPVDGHWSSWSHWTTCSASCSQGTMSRSRQCNKPAAQHGGHDCVGSVTFSQSCNSLVVCPVDGHWSLWSDWTVCSVSCGQGTMSRLRLCNKPAAQHGGHDCVGSATSSLACNSHVVCPVDGHWSTWSHWTACTASCGKGTRSKSRQCNSPAPRQGGHDCVGSHTLSHSCNSPVLCPIDGHWSPWSYLTACSTSCGHGTMSRSRQCNNPAAQHGGQDCAGSDTLTLACNSHVVCPAHVWSEWSNWSTCQRTCGYTNRQRTRTCSGNHHSDCEGAVSELDPCHLPHCPAHGYWRHWGPWSSCAATCGTSNQTRTRTCHPPQNGGRPCTGHSSEVHACQLAACLVPIDGHWTVWSSWGPCSVHCGSGTQRRHRSCSNPAPKNGGQICHGGHYSTKQCALDPCVDVDGGWGDWSSWSACTVTCGTNAERRYIHRRCDNPTPQNHGARCQGMTTVSVYCPTVAACPTHSASSTCAQGFQYDSTIGCYMLSLQSVPYSLAESKCSQHGAHVLTSHSYETEMHVGGLMRNHANSHHHYVSVWLGIHWDKQQGVWIWDNQKQLTRSDYNNFYLNWFTNGTDTKGCITKNTQYWNTASCQDLHPYICVA